MNVTVVGAGYVGLVTSACLAELGNTVVCVENDPVKLGQLQTGRVPIYENGLPELLHRNNRTGRLQFTNDLPCAVERAEVIVLCVGTPAGPGNEPDLSHIEAVATAIGGAMDTRYRVIVTKSTVPVGSGDWVSLLVREAFCARIDVRQPVGVGGVMGLSESEVPRLPHFDVVSNPEFLREGSAIEDMLFPDRIVLGASSHRALALMRQLYQPILHQTFAWTGLRRRQEPVPLVETDLTSAEMIKYAANAFLATKISFINEIACICERTGADVRAVARGIGLDQRIGEAFLQAGMGWGGSCFPKDIAALTALAAEYGCESTLIRAVESVNARQRLIVVTKLQERLKILKGKAIGLLGLSFKGGTDDVRDAPALTLARRLLELGAKVRGYDPQAGVKAGAVLPGLRVVARVEELAEGADALVLVTDWPEFERLDWAALAGRMRGRLLVDGRNSLDREVVIGCGLEYIGIGR